MISKDRASDKGSVFSFAKNTTIIMKTKDLKTKVLLTFL